jgi:hypothetical protein
MKFKDFINENKEKHGVFAFGRMNPPTTGHEVLVNKVHEIAKKHDAPHHVVVSHTQDAKKNPLSAEQKLKHAKRFFPHTNISAASKEKPTLMHHLSDLHKQGVTHLHMVAGSDRVHHYHELINTYNGKSGPHGHYNFKHIEVHSAGERDPDADDASGMSASKMRKHATEGNYHEFRKGIPSHVKEEHAKELYDHVRHGMKIKENINIQFENLLNEGVHDHGIFKAVFLGGGPGSGKDYVMKHTLHGHGMTEINSDKALEYLMDKEHLDKKMPDSEEEQRGVVRKRAKNVTELRQRLAIHGRNGLIINGTADDPEKIAEIKKRLEKLGYESKMLMVHTKDDVSQARNVQRGQEGGRTVPENIRKEKWDKVQAAKAEHAKLFGQHYHEFDNSEDLKTAHPDVVKAKKDEMHGLFKKIREFTKQPSKTPQSQKWIAKQLQRKDTESISKSGAEKLAPHGSQAAETAKNMGLQYYGTGRYGTKGRVTHRTVNDNLIDVSKVATSVKPKKKINEQFENFLSESISISITADTPEEIKQALKLLKSEPDDVKEEDYTFSNDSSYRLLTLGKTIREGNENVEILKESIQETRTSRGSSRRDTTESRSDRTDYRTSNTRITEDRKDAATETKGKITIQEIRNRAQQKLQKESIDKGIEPGISMAAAGESPDRDMGEKNKKKTGKATQVSETIGAGGEMATSMSDQKEDELKKQGISLKSWKAKRPIG